MVSRYNDSTKGWEGQGIDKEDGFNWVRKQMDRGCLKEMGFDLGSSVTKDKPVCKPPREKADTGIWNSRMGRNATANFGGSGRRGGR
jgi:hypothetical protein